MQIGQVLKNKILGRTEVEIILADLLNKDRSFLHAYPEHNLSSTLKLRFVNASKRRLQNEPLPYILGYKEFFGLKFFVDRRVLIPRPETEDLVERILKYINNNYTQKQIKVCDVGTGSGCIAVSLAKALPKAKIIATDTDAKALTIAKKNAKLHRVEGRIKFIKGDLLSPVSEKINVIVANLPYIKTNQIDKLDPQISKWEPKTALDGGTDGMKLYKKLFFQAPKHLAAGGKIFYEVDGDIFDLERNTLLSRQT